MKRIAIAVTVFLAATAANADIYKWKDKNGKTVISDKPPAESVTQKPTTVADTAPAAASKTTAEKELDFKKRQKEAQDNAEKADKEQAAAAEKKANCESARRTLQALESGERISLRDDKGERYFMEDAQREQETAKARQAIQTNCK